MSWGLAPPGCVREEADAFRRRWGGAWAQDPFHNPNLSADHLDCRIRTASE